MNCLNHMTHRDVRRGAGLEVLGGLEVDVESLSRDDLEKHVVPALDEAAVA